MRFSLKIVYTSQWERRQSLIVRRRHVQLPVDLHDVFLLQMDSSFECVKIDQCVNKAPSAQGTGCFCMILDPRGRGWKPAAIALRAVCGLQNHNLLAERRHEPALPVSPFSNIWIYTSLDLLHKDYTPADHRLQRAPLTKIRKLPFS